MSEYQIKQLREGRKERMVGRREEERIDSGPQFSGTGHEDTYWFRIDMTSPTASTIRKQRKTKTATQFTLSFLIQSETPIPF